MEISMNPHSYNITVRRANFDGEVYFEARVKELPDVAEYADTFDEAYALAIDTIETTAEVFAAKGKAMPAPYEPADDFSGRVTLRMPKTLHRSLSETADQEGISLNQYLVNVLSYQSGYSSCYQAMTGYSAPVVTSTTKQAGRPKLTLVARSETPINQASSGWH